MTPSPMREENQRVAREMPASTTARPAMTSAMRTMSPAVPSSRAIRLTMSPASSGVTTPMTDEATTSSRKMTNSRRYGRATPRMRRTVPLGISRPVTEGSRRNERMADMDIMELLTSTPPPPVDRPSRSSNAAAPGPLPDSLSATSDEIVQSAHLGGPLGGVLALGIVADGGADQRRGRPAAPGRRGGQRGGQVGHRRVQLGRRHDHRGQAEGAGLGGPDRPPGQAQLQ